MNNGWRPKTPLALNKKDAETFDKLMEELDNHDDIQEIYSNAE
ncbi:MAG: YebC/PmpR family DNA-binding transcriptional regulator [Patescibacteria group bacterium]